MARHVIRALAAPLLIATLAAGCGDSAAPSALAPDAHDALGAQASARRAGQPSADVNRQLAELRRATAPFHRIERAGAAGYDAVLTDCMSDPTRGAMGVHVGDLGLFDAVVHPARPEILVYEPQPDGSMKLVAVEFAVPFGAWTNAEPPRLFEQDFSRNETFGLWVLHAWVWRDNPDGLFASWNPNVSC